MRSIACRRLSSSSSVYWVTSPWRSALNPAPIDLTAPMLRTTRPKATPRSCSMVMPGSANAVVTGSPAGAGCVIGAIVDTSRAYAQARRAVQDEIPPALLNGFDVLDQAAQAKLTHGGGLPGLVIGEPAGGEAQEVPLVRQRRQQVGTLAVRGGPGAGGALGTGRGLG